MRTGFYLITAIAGERNGETIIGLQPAGTAIPGNEPFAVDNLIRAEDHQLTGNGFGYALDDGTYANPLLRGFPLAGDLSGVLLGAPHRDGGQRIAGGFRGPGASVTTGPPRRQAPRGSRRRARARPLACRASPRRRHLVRLRPEVRGTPGPGLATLQRTPLAPDMKPRRDAMMMTPEARPQAEWADCLAAGSGRWRNLVRTPIIRVQQRVIAAARTARA